MEVERNGGGRVGSHLYSYRHPPMPSNNGNGVC